HRSRQMRRLRTNRKGNPPVPGRSCTRYPSRSEPPGFSRVRRAWARGCSRRIATPACCRMAGHAGLRSTSVPLLGEEPLCEEQDRGRGFFRLSVQHLRPDTHVSAALDLTYGHILVTRRTERRRHVVVLLLSPVLVAIRIDKEHWRQIGTKIAS